MQGDGRRTGKPKKAVHKIAGRKRAGNDQDDVFRAVLLGLIDEFGWTQGQLGERMGLSQGQVSNYLLGKRNQKVTVENITRLCNALDKNPIQVWGRHPDYEKHARAYVTFPKDHLYNVYNELLKNAEALGLLTTLDRARELGVFEQAVAGVANLVRAAEEAHERGRQRAMREAGKSTRRRRSRPHIS